MIVAPIDRDGIRQFRHQRANNYGPVEARPTGIVRIEQDTRAEVVQTTRAPRVVRGCS
jgi:hypothetical protein